MTYPYHDINLMLHLGLLWFALVLLCLGLHSFLSSPQGCNGAPYGTSTPVGEGLEANSTFLLFPIASLSLPSKAAEQNCLPHLQLLGPRREVCLERESCALKSNSARWRRSQQVHCVPVIGFGVYHG